MHPDAFQKLCRTPAVQLPHLAAEQGKSLCRLSELLFKGGELRYWGVTSDSLMYRGHSILHCYNFGNMNAVCPWQASMVNFGHNLPLHIVRCGTVRRQRDEKSLLDRVRQPYLALEYETDAAAAEYLQAGMLISESGAPEQRRHFDVVFPDGVEAPGENGVLFYFLVRRIPFTAVPAERWVPRGAPAGLACVSITLQQPVVMETGWPVLILEKDRWIWGVVSAA